MIAGRQEQEAGEPNPIFHISFLIFHLRAVIFLPAPQLTRQENRMTNEKWKIMENEKWKICFWRLPPAAPFLPTADYLFRVSIAAL